MPMMVENSSRRVPSEGSKGVKSSARTLDILDLLVGFPEGLTLTDMGHALRIPISSLHALAATLVQRNYLLLDEKTKRYRLGAKILQLAGAFSEQNTLISLADPVMDRIRRVTSETTSLAVFQEDTIVFVHKCPGKGIVQVVNPVGTRLPSHATGSGKVMLAYLSGEELDGIYPEEALPASTPSTITSKTVLKRALAEIRARGYAFDNEESAIGVWAVASCIRDQEASPVAALSIVAPTFRLQPKDHSKWHSLVLEGAAEISAMLGFRAESTARFPPG